MKRKNEYIGKIISIAGPKGGVGRSSLSGLLSQSLFLAGHKVLLVDADFGLGKLENMFGISAQRGLPDYFKQDEPLIRVIHRIDDDFHFLSSGHGLISLVNMQPARLEGLFLDLDAFKDEYDYILVDNAPGLHLQQLEILKYADINIVVTDEHPGTIADSLFYIKLSEFSQAGSSSFVLINKSNDDGKSTFNIISEACIKMGVQNPSFLGAVRNDDRISSHSGCSISDLFARVKSENKNTLKEMDRILQQSRRERKLKNNVSTEFEGMQSI